ncbi:hypothetical protein Fuma_04627 [Fuerstiella marisgermanici]|uniref:Uncharacterized protein n=2 Tax=Fuerstiella marisgermanici TaxID=1891926 RepID=A0A1P8WLP0_9PLAN|nr:hypothetical protein Fuma_04627 [Fuerstiella marisgermanici]
MGGGDGRKEESARISPRWISGSTAVGLIVLVALAGMLQLALTHPTWFEKRPRTPAPRSVSRFSSVYLNPRQIPGVVPDDLVQTYINQGLLRGGFGVQGGGHGYLDRMRYGPAGHPTPDPLMHIWHFQSGHDNDDVMVLVDIYGVKGKFVHMVSVRVADYGSSQFEVEAAKQFERLGVFEFQGSDAEVVSSWLSKHVSGPAKLEVAGVTYEIPSDRLQYSSTLRTLLIEGPVVTKTEQ